MKILNVKIIITFIVGVSVGFLISNFKNLDFNKYYTIYATFDNIGTVEEGSEILFNNVPCGKVAKIKLAGSKILLEMYIQEGVQILKNSEFCIRPLGLLGNEHRVWINQKTQKFVEIQKIGFLEPNDTLTGGFENGIIEYLIGKGKPNFFNKSDSIYSIVKDLRKMIKDAEMCQE